MIVYVYVTAPFCNFLLNQLVLWTYVCLGGVVSVCMVLRNFAMFLILKLMF